MYGLCNGLHIVWYMFIHPTMLTVPVDVVGCGYMETATKRFVEDAVRGGYSPCEFEPIVEVKTDEGPTGNPEFEPSFCWLRNAEGEGCGYPVSDIVIDPLAWQAVGKTRGWCLDRCQNGNVFLGYETQIDEYGNEEQGRDVWDGCSICVTAEGYFDMTPRAFQHRFIDHLANGKSIEEALGEIEK